MKLFTPKSFKRVWSALRSKVPVRAAVATPAGVPPNLRRILRPEAAMNWMSPMLASITPTYIEQALRGALFGSHVQQWELFDLMEDTWPRLLKNLNEIKDDAISYHWKLDAYAEEDLPPSDSALERKKLVHAAVCGMKPARDRDENSFDKTLYDVLDAWAKGTSVLEIDWELRDGPAGEMIAPRTTTWVHPRHYAWSDEGFLGLVFDENAGSVFMSPRRRDVVQFPEHKFLVALCKSRSTHVQGAALLRALAWWWCAANFSAEWLLNFAQIFGLPIRWAHYQNGAPQTLLDQIADMLENMGSAGWAMFPEGTTLELKEASKSGDALPQAHMIDRADKQCDLLLLRQTLTSDVGDSGSRALGEVHERGRDNEVSGAAMFAADVLQQLVESVLILNYGDPEDAPRFCPEPRQKEDTKANSEIIQAAVNMGVKVPLKWAHKKLGIPLPQADEAVLEAPAPQTPPGQPGQPGESNPDAVSDPVLRRQIEFLRYKKQFEREQEQAAAAAEMQARRNGRAGNGHSIDLNFRFDPRLRAKNESGPDEDLVRTAVADAVGAREQWLAPLNDELDRLARLARNGKIGDAELTSFLEAAARRLPELFGELKVDALADSIEAALGTAVVEAVRDDVAAGPLRAREAEGQWRTIRGTPVLIKEGESVESAVARAFPESTSGGKSEKVKAPNEREKAESGDRGNGPGDEGGKGRGGESARRAIESNASGERAGGAGDVEADARQKAALARLYDSDPSSRVAYNKENLIGEGAEHLVERSADGTRVIKHTKGFGATFSGTDAPLGSFAGLREATPQEYAARVQLSNQVFGDDARIEGVSKAGGNVGLAVSQTYVGGTKPKQAEIDSYLQSKGFKKVKADNLVNDYIGDKTWYHPKDGIIIADTKPDNFKKTKAGKLVAVDVIAARAEPGTALERAMKAGTKP